ncbi:MAG TPA: DUF3783 domain-containing protein [Desulfosalsimonadaceae bacterium]|nr:DUF3783 domain-containing protein [Desulfosalsimonadaceae bacterium]
MSEGTFQKVGKSAKTLYGPRAALVCGFTSEEQKSLMAFMAGIELTDLSVVFATEADSEALLKDLVTRPDQSGKESNSGLERAIILSGITEEELHRTLSAYRKLDLPRPLWATLTPYSESWPLSALLEELQKERMATEQKK